jgi:single-stranded-DNA-specific exonuclease
MNKKWRIRDIPAADLAVLEQKTSIPPVLLRIMWNRGLRESDVIERFFEPRSRYLASPFLLDGVCPALHRIRQALATDESIRVFGDRDVDGITSTVVLLETLRTLSKKVDFTVPVIEDGYGLNPDYLDTAKRDGVTLLITVDCGISNEKEVEYARSLGIDVIITDHHEPPHNLPRAVAIIDPKMSDAPFPYKELAGVGVSLKVSLAILLSRSEHLAKPLIAFDFHENEMDAVRFSPFEGFSVVKSLSPACVQDAVLLFWDQKERDSIAELLPFIKRSSGVRFLADLAQQHSKDLPELTKEAISRDLCIPPSIFGGKRLILLFLKYLEAMEPSVKTMWQRALDVLTIGTIADMVPMRGENRTIAQMGMKFITNTKRIGLAALFPLLGWQKKTITEKDVSFGIAPILNSSGRLRSAELAINLLITDFPPKAQALAEELFNLNIERKKLAEECYRLVRSFLLQQADMTSDRILLVYAPMPNQGVTGIVATRLMLEFHRPVFVLLQDHGKLLGSGRSYQSISIMEALHSCADILEKYGGHIGAAGVTLPVENIDEFRRRLNEYSSSNITDAELLAEWVIDAEISIDSIDDDFLKDILRFAPFGIENPAPLFMARSVSFYEIRKVGETKNHLRFKFRKSTGQAIFGIGFGLGKLLATDSISHKQCDLVFTVEPNDYNGTRSAQIVVHDVIFPGETPTGS